MLHSALFIPRRRNQVKTNANVTIQFYSGNATSWAGLIRVDNETYTWMGNPGPQTVNQTAFQYTATKSIFTLDVDNLVQMIVTFQSPVTPTDIRRQSLTFSYLNVEVSSLDGSSHDVQLYTDISAGKFLGISS